MVNRAANTVLTALIAVLALGDGILHLSLDWVLFRGRLFGSPFPPGNRPGPAPTRPLPARPPANPLVLPTNELFLLNFAGEVVLVGFFLYSRRWAASRRWMVDVVMILYAAATFTAWWIYGRPNPMGLGLLSKSVEVVLIIALLADLVSMLRPSRVAPAATASSSTAS